MSRKLVLVIILTIALVGMLGVVFKVQRIEASGTIYIRAKGSVEPSTANITSLNNVTYTFTDNIYEPIVVERDNIVVDGAGYILQGSGSGTGISLTGINNVTIKNMEIKAFTHGIDLVRSSNNNISGNNITSNLDGIVLYRLSNNNTVSGNKIAENEYDGVSSSNSSNNNIYENNITNSDYGIWLDYSSNNNITGNNVTNNDISIQLSVSSNNIIYHNKFINNTNQAYDDNPSSNDWHHPTLLEGNYWDDYAGVDDGSGVGKHAIAGDGIGDTLIPHPDTGYDFYPLMEPWTSPQPTPVGGISVPVNKLELLAPYVGLTILLAVAVITLVYVKKEKHRD